MASKKTSSAHTTNSGFDFEASLAKLENLVTRMEKGDMSLEESLKAFEDGVKLTRLCQETLGSAQQKVQVLMEQQSAGQQNRVSLKEMIFDDNNDESEDGDDNA